MIKNDKNSYNMHLNLKCKKINYKISQILINKSINIKIIKMINMK